MEISDYAILGTLKAYDSKGKSIDTFWLMGAEELPDYLSKVQSVDYQKPQRIDNTAPFSLRERVSVSTPKNVVDRLRYRLGGHCDIDKVMDVVEEAVSTTYLTELE